VTIVAAQVTDEDTTDPLDAMTSDYQFSFTVTTTLFNEAFEAGMPADWALFNVDGRTPDAQVSYVNAAWIVREDFAHNSSDHAAFSTSFYSPAGAADDWMMTPALQLPPGVECILEWNAVAYDAAYRDGYEVRISTATQTVADGLANAALFSLGGESSSWTHHAVSLTDYAGATAYLAFRNNSNDQFILLVDDVQVTCP
jgi:hypothetical protein